MSEINKLCHYFILYTRRFKIYVIIIMVFKHYLVFFLLNLVSLGAHHHFRQLTQLSSTADDIKKSIFIYIKKIDFRPESNIGDMIITNNTNFYGLIVI
jgi:hypothetical protein